MVICNFSILDFQYLEPVNSELCHLFLYILPRPYLQVSSSQRGPAGSVAEGRRSF